MSCTGCISCTVEPVCACQPGLCISGCACPLLCMPVYVVTAPKPSLLCLCVCRNPGFTRQFSRMVCLDSKQGLAPFRRCEISQLVGTSRIDVLYGLCVQAHECCSIQIRISVTQLRVFGRQFWEVHWKFFVCLFPSCYFRVLTGDE